MAVTGSVDFDDTAALNNETVEIGKTYLFGGRNAVKGDLYLNDLRAPLKPNEEAHDLHNPAMVWRRLEQLLFFRLQAWIGRELTGRKLSRKDRILVEPEPQMRPNLNDIHDRGGGYKPRLLLNRIKFSSVITWTVSTWGLISLLFTFHRKLSH
ncbi:uncharacterized protein EV420DRAFT_1483177 [Desarmillaria tabescens]|uniref:Uncharacterized protein n=1 Tax=Armillaria tabescens TaxID=1929756 RepID=A0AA39JVF8_ARMTA|nr:uncharacterized protein EV420DRAFT_1483177 [Desarmillaria tabescens]KAK0449661.1 hypothetical protein EV420DRAFT_1483177 [Desarmillaria tabescens]